MYVYIHTVCVYTYIHTLCIYVCLSFDHMHSLHDVMSEEHDDEVRYVCVSTYM